MSDVSILLGKTLFECYELDGGIIFKTSEEETYKMYHNQSCCESVDLQDITGDLMDLIGAPILHAEESTEDKDGGTWTFYKFATVNGWVDIRWFGEDNYYSVSVDFEKIY